MRAVASRLFVVCVLLQFVGCPRGQQAVQGGKEPAEVATPRASVTLRVLVVNEPALAEAINRLRGEWAERSGGQMSATATDWKDVATAKSIEADVIIFPSRYLGELCTRGWLLPVRTSVLEGAEFDANDVFPLVRRELMRWGGQAMALPLGIDLVLPGKLSKTRPGLNILSLAAPGTVSNEREGVLFDPQTMKPRITDPAFVDALQRLATGSPTNRAMSKETHRVVPVLGYADRLIGVTSDSRNGASAFKLAAWLASAETSKQLASAGEPMLPVRRSFVVPASSRDSTKSANERGDDAKSFEAALNAEQCLLVPRIPGVDEYVAALDEAGKTPQPNKAAAEAALQKVAERWEQITEAHGRDAQRQAYLKHLHISEK